MTSIRRYLIVGLLSAIATTTLLAAIYGYRSSVAEAEQLFDTRLAATAAVLSETPAGYYRTATGDSAIAFQIWQGGRLEASSGNVPDAPIAAFERGYSDVRVGGFEWRAYASYLAESDRWVLVAESADIRLALADNIVLRTVLPVLLALPVYALLIWIVVGQGMRPISQLAGLMRARRSDDLSPLPDLQPPLELQGLVESINDLLRRLDGAFERERQFAADAAHELRNPVSALKVKLHNLRREAGADDARLGSLQESIERLEHSVEQVLMLYRMSPEQFAASFEAVDIAAVARDTVAELYPQLEKRQQSIEIDGEAGGIRGDRFALQTLLGNLIENASRYSGDSGRIRVTVATDADAVTLTVEDSGPGIPEDLRERVFERFYRAQHDYDSGGSGIGLAIVKNIADIHGASVTLGESGFDTGLAVRVTFSAA